MKRKNSLFPLVMLFTTAALLLTSSLSAGNPAHGNPAQDEDDLMKRKTRYAQEILRGLALGDLALVHSQAKDLERVTIDADFEARGERFAMYGRAFLKSVRDLKKESENGNLAGSYYQFTRMTGLCFSCHEHLRESGTQSGNK